MSFDAAEKIEGLLLLDKPSGITSFSLVAKARCCLGVQKIGHCGTLDPLASGLMILVVSRAYTKLSDQLLCQDKVYIATLHLGKETSTYDAEGVIVAQHAHKPSIEELRFALKCFQGKQMQIPPMFSAKKKNGRKLYELAREGKTVERAAVAVTLDIALLDYTYPYLQLGVHCSKGTYIRSLAHDLGQVLKCGAHLIALRRTHSGPFSVKEALPASYLCPGSATEVVVALQKHTSDWHTQGVA